VVYPTFWTAANLSVDMIDRLIDDVPSIVNLKWRAADQLHYLLGAKRFSSRVCVTDNQISPVDSYLAGVRSFNIHMCNFWPEWGARFIQMLEDGEYAEVHSEFMRVLLPFYELVWEIGKFTGGEGHIDKVCAELTGFDSSPTRPPTRDIREKYRDRIRELLEEFGVPHLKGG
jgi:4-hydroxy-tetrahydrodipicolinate synthase